jgi:hypothetical protein
MVAVQRLTNSIHPGKLVGVGGTITWGAYFVWSQAVSSLGTDIKIVALQSRRKKEEKEMMSKKGRAEVGGAQTSPQFPSYCVTNSHGMLMRRQRERSTDHVTRSIRLPTVVDLTWVENVGHTKVLLLLRSLLSTVSYFRIQRLPSSLLRISLSFRQA